MHSLSEFGANVPAFLAKLWKLVDDPETNELISWTEEGTSFYIRDQAQFSRKLLPMYYKHNNMASFIRQLNMYGFHKIVSADAGSLRLDRDEMEFAHNCFLRGHPYLLEHIKRKVGKSQILTGKLEDGKESTNGGVVVKAEFMNKILSEVKSMRGRQDTVENRLTAMKQENEALWRELSLLRQKHIKQQAIVNKLIQFLMTLVQPSSQRLSKRRYPLMINNVAHPGGKSNGKVANLNGNDQLRQLIVSLRANQIMSRSPSGPTIHELDGDSILPEVQGILSDVDSEPEPSNTITLHLPVTELAEALDSDLEPEILNADPAVLNNLDQTDIHNQITNTSSVPLMEVNSIDQDTLEEGLKASTPSPDLLLTVAPSELNPAVLVPGLQTNKAKSPIQLGAQTAPQKILTRSASAAASVGSPRSVMTRKSTGNMGKAVSSGMKGSSLQFKEMSAQEANKELADSQPAAKKELRVLPSRNRKKKSNNSKAASFESENFSSQEEIKPVDILADLGIVDPESSNASISESATLNTDGLNGSMGGSVTSPAPNQFIAFPESPPIVHSPVASPASHCSSMLSVPMSPLSGPTITDITSPLVVQPSSNSTTEQLSPTSGGHPSPYDMTLACTSQGNNSPANPSTLKSAQFNRCEVNAKDDLDLHVGAMDAELGQLKDFLNNSGIQLDANTLLGLFSSDGQILPEGDSASFNSKMDSSGNELMYYQPDFMDLEDIWNNDNDRSSSPLSPADVFSSSSLNTPVMMPTSPGFSGPAAKRRRV